MLRATFQFHNQLYHQLLYSGIVLKVTWISHVLYNCKATRYFAWFASQSVNISVSFCGRAERFIEHQNAERCALVSMRNQVDYRSAVFTYVDSTRGDVASQ